MAKKKTGGGTTLKKSTRTDDLTSAKQQNARLAQLMAADWNAFEVHRVVRIERDNPESTVKGWRCFYQE